MEIVIHTAIYGERQGAHTLLAASKGHSLPFAKIAIHTDRPANLPPDIKWEEYIGGFTFERYYVLTKTFPDFQASRAGMVFTHAFLIDIDAAVQIDDLSVIIGLFLDRPDHTLAERISSISTSINNAPSSRSLLVNDMARVERLAYHLVHQQTPAKPVVWVGQENFNDAVCVIWSNLWPEARRQFRFRLSFAPQDVEGQSFTMLTTPSPLESRWYGYPTVRKTETLQVVTPATAFLLGRSDGFPLRQLMDSLGADALQLIDLPKLEQCVSYLSIPADHRSVEKTRALARLLGYLVPNPSQGVEIKKIVLTQLVEISSQGSASDIKALRNFDVTPFLKGEEVITQAVGDWFEKSICNSAESHEIATIIELALLAPTTVWGKEIVRILYAKILDWSLEIASSIWQWWQVAPALVDRLSLPLTSEVEDSLTATCPYSLDETLGEHLLTKARDNLWWKLHAAVASAIYEPRKAVAIHCRYDTNVSFAEGVRVVASRIPLVVFLSVALDSSDERLHQVAGEICAANPQMLTSLDVTIPSWRSIWLHAIVAGSEPLQGVINPEQTVHGLLNEVLQGVDVDERLLNAVAATPWGDLTTYSERVTIWRHLSVSSASIFLDTTADGWLKRLHTSPDRVLSIEEQLEEALYRGDRITKALKQRRGNFVEYGLLLFHRLPRLTEKQWMEWIDWIMALPISVNPIDAIGIGKHIATRRWRAAAEQLATQVSNRERVDLISAIAECYWELSVLTRFRLWSIGKTTLTPSWEEWWHTFTELVVELYSAGPNDSNAWRRAGGDPSIIETDVAGRVSWERALVKLRAGGGGKNLHTETLLQVIGEDYPQNPRVHLLKDVFVRMPR